MFYDLFEASAEWQRLTQAIETVVTVPASPGVVVGAKQNMKRIGLIFSSNAAATIRVTFGTEFVSGGGIVLGATFPPLLLDWVKFGSLLYREFNFIQDGAVPVPVSVWEVFRT